MRLLVAAAALLVALPVQAQDAELVVTFDRAVSSHEAVELVRQLDASAEIDLDLDFAPVTLGATLDGLPPGEVSEALFESGAISVTVVSRSAQFASVGLELPDGTNAARIFRGYTIRATYTSTLPTDTAVARFEAAVGVEPTSVGARASELRVSAPRATVRALAERLRARPEVIAVRREARS